VTLRPGGTVELTVVDRSGRPVENATVDVLNEGSHNVVNDHLTPQRMNASVTDGNGRFSLGPILPGEYRVVVRTEEDSTEDSVRVDASETSELRLRLAGR
jgi:uncharacterized GH25 family protein